MLMTLDLRLIRNPETDFSWLWSYLEDDTLLLRLPEIDRFITWHPRLLAGILHSVDDERETRFVLEVSDVEKFQRDWPEFYRSVRQLRCRVIQANVQQSPAMLPGFFRYHSEES